ncbi:transglycosylase SLT domain-containing protein [bacterium]|nr:transglycosylase SLT domain-containing protein [bacterium]
MPVASAASNLTQQRQAFATALEDIEAGKLDRAPKSLADYPLAPYLDAAILRREIVQNPGPDSDGRLVRWLDAHGNLPLANDLRRDWLKRVARRGDWRIFHTYYQPVGGTSLQCHYVYARTKVEAAEKVEPAAMDLWLHGRSQPDACDPVFAWLKAGGKLTEERIYERMMLAMDARQGKLVRYLMRKLPSSRQAYARDWLAMRGNPAREIAKVAKAGVVREDRRDLLATGVKTLAWRDSARAYARLQTLQGVRGIDKSLRDHLRRDVALGLAYDRDARGYELFQQVPTGILNREAQEWRVRSALYQKAWDDVAAWIEAMPADLQRDDAWSYWLGRAYLHAGRGAQALPLFRRVARDRSYYGYLAADQISTGYAIDHKPVPADPVAQQTLNQLAGVQRAREWLALDRPAEARIEWVAVVHGLDKTAQQQASLLAASWQWYEQSIITLARAKYWDVMHLRYPAAHFADIEQLSGKTQVPADFILGITRSESLFARDARSGANARGLMQLLPATAKRVARGAGVKYRGASSLYEPGVNLELGTYYLADLLERFDGSLPFAAAAYNAGEHRVDRWRPDEATEAAIWVENIPYTETRLYVQKVIKHMTGFAWRRSGQTVPVTARLGTLPLPAEASG